jgi:hypothetical protein
MADEMRPLHVGGVQQRECITDQLDSPIVAAASRPG